MIFARQEQTYVDAVELCRLGCKAIVLEKFDSARRYFELAADQGCLEAAVSLEVLLASHYVEPRQTSANSYMIEVPAGLQFRPNIQLSYYSH